MKNRIENIKKQVVNIPLTYNDFVEIVQKEFIDMGIEVTLNAVDNFPKNESAVNGYFNTYEWEDFENIELVLIVSSESNSITINSDSWNFLEHQMAQTVEHELIHREQTIKRSGFQPITLYPSGACEEQMRIIYLSDPDEIQAYANDIVLDLKKLYTNHGVCKRLTNYSDVTAKESPILVEYITLFGEDSATVKEVVKKALKTVTS
jgi:hypothetical protein